MTNETILRKVIEKAVKNGYNYPMFLDDEGRLAIGVVKQLTVEGSYWSLIFSHSFAKAFWGEEPVEPGMGGHQPVWTIHLQEMVLEEEPLKYLAKFI